MIGKTYDFRWHFPLPRTHTGMLLGNGNFGVMAWGAGGVLRLTLGRADWWDHQGGRAWTPDKNFAAIRRLLEAHDEAGIRALFAETTGGSGHAIRPSVIPVGRVDLDFGRGVELVGGRLDIHRGEAHITLRAGPRTGALVLTVDPAHPRLLVRLPANVPLRRVTPVAAQACCGEQLAERGFAAPRPLRGSGGLRGFVQPSPRDAACAVAVRRDTRHLLLSAELGADADIACAQATAHVAGVADAKAPRALVRRSRAWWTDYWRDVPRLRLPNRKLQFLYDYGMYKFATLTSPEAVPATLQGPWVEEYTFPPWSNDYHFNINVQMCYWPAFHGNRLAHLRPLFDLIHRWMPELRHNARCFLGIEDGLMLPHAVDDRCHTIGSFWTGTIDHGCTAWVAQMMFQYYLYSQDTAFLRERAYPFMCGAMRVYEEMIEERDGALVLPVSTSPEYGGSGMSAWGRNASFQLAAIHMLAEMLERSAAVLGETPRPNWSAIRARLPRAAVIGTGASAHIGLWEGQDLDETHRHHSHLAGITPFDVFEPSDPETRALLEASIQRWIHRGPGLWSGWCVPWAAMLHLRFGNADMAELLLEAFERVFTNEGHGTRHNGFVSGWTLMGVGPVGGRPRDEREIMQMDAGMSAASAVLEMMLHSQRGVNHLFAGAPAQWGAVAFDGILTEGAFVVGAARDASCAVTEVRLLSRAGGTCRLANPWPHAARLVRTKGRPQRLSGPVLDIALQTGETAVIRP